MMSNLLSEAVRGLERHDYPSEKTSSACKSRSVSQPARVAQGHKHGNWHEIRKTLNTAGRRFKNQRLFDRQMTEKLNFLTLRSETN
ncbi:hypothetical protein ALO75_102616 [Pseudomonas syringae pv. coryli]|uniref:Uncharacterized protein n=1 Tax=Pseudomonas syringae pv. coryli TaxID=317659 RepID=A0A0P9MA62_9PSED|nr:hypothetical protein ALO75_102616 [Pseudomonas syringae pv. coryli]